jgi:MFS family permease
MLKFFEIVKRMDFRLELLKNRNFKLFLLGHFLSFTGSWINNTALQWLIYRLTNSSFYLGLANFLSSFPIILLGFFTGFFIDRWNRKNLFSWILFFSILPPLGLGLSLQFGVLTFEKIAFFVFFAGCLAAFDVPLRQVIISDIVPLKTLTQALSLQSISFNIARMIGPVIAGWFIARDYFSICFYLNAMSFIPFFIFMKWFIHFPEKRGLSKKENLWASLKEAFFYLKKKVYLFKVICAVASFTFFGVSLLVLLPIVVHKGLGGGAREFALASSFIGIGAILGAVSVIFKKSLKNKPFHLFLATLILGTGLAGISLVKSFYLLLFFCLLTGFSFTNFIPVANSFIQEECDPGIRGRIMSFFSMSFLGIYPFGNLTVGFLGAHLSYHFLIPIYVILLLFLNSVFLLKNKGF